MTDQTVTIVDFHHSARATALQGALSDSAGPCRLLSSEQWLSETARNSRSALLFYFGRGMPGPRDVERMRKMADGQKWRAVFEGERPTKLPKSLLLPPRYFLWPEDRAELEDWLEAPDQAGLSPAHFGMLGTSPLFQNAMTTLTQFARSEAPILLSGASGTGKSLAAHVAHHLSPRANRPFVHLHCGQFQRAMQSAQSGAPFAGAAGGTLFLNDLDDLDPDGQVDLLNWLQAQAQLVAPKHAPRLIAASIRNLSGSEAFRDDLYYRLAVLTLRLPALKDRAEDSALLGQHFADRFAQQAGAPAKPLSGAFQKALKAYDWPGNVRELENFMHRAWVLSRGPEIVLQHCGAPGLESTCAHDDEVRPYHDARQATLRAFETVYLEKLMRASGGNVTRAAEMAGTERRSLGRMLKRNDMAPSSTS